MTFCVLRDPHESAKLRALGPLVPSMPRALRALVPHVLSCLKCLTPYMLSCLMCVVLYMPSYFMCLESYVLLHVPRTLHALLLTTMISNFC